MAQWNEVAQWIQIRHIFAHWTPGDMNYVFWIWTNMLRMPEVLDMLMWGCDKYPGLQLEHAPENNSEWACPPMYPACSPLERKADSWMLAYSCAQKAAPKPTWWRVRKSGKWLGWGWGTPTQAKEMVRLHQSGILPMDEISATGVDGSHISAIRPGW